MAGAALAFPYGAKKSSKDASLYVDFIGAYRNNPDFQNLIDSVQASLRCFGFSVESFRDWCHNVYYRCDLGNSSEESAKDVNMNCAHGVLLKSDQAAWDVVYTRSCVDACHMYFENNFRFYSLPALLVVMLCLTLIIFTHDVHDEIGDLILIYRKYYEAIREGQVAMQEAGIIEVVKMGGSGGISTKRASKTM
ncbi:tetraspanin-10-like [Amblyomma americanum]